jgi:hypothetical protein
LVNSVFPEGFRLENVKGEHVETPEFALDPENGRPLWTFQIQYIHANDRGYHPTAIKVPAGTSEVIIDAEISAVDARTEQRLTVRLTPKPAA